MVRKKLSPNKGKISKIKNQYIREKILSYVRWGSSYKVAAVASGISESAFNEWRRKGREAIEKNETNSDYYEFMEDLYEAEAQSELVLLGVIRKSAIEGIKYTEKSEEYTHDKTTGRKTLIKSKITNKVIPPNTTDAKYILSNRFPDRWGRKAQEEQQQSPIEFANEVKEALSAIENTVPLEFDDQEDSQEE